MYETKSQQNCVKIKPPFFQSSLGYHNIKLYGRCHFLKIYFLKRHCVPSQGSFEILPATYLMNTSHKPEWVFVTNQKIKQNHFLICGWSIKTFLSSNVHVQILTSHPLPTPPSFLTSNFVTYKLSNKEYKRKEPAPILLEK